MIPPVADRFVAGETPAAALDHAEALDDDGIGTILNYLGEHHESHQDANEDAEQYLELIDAIEERDVPARLSVKPSQLGLDVDEELFVEHARTIADRAAANDVFLWFDMEDHTTTDVTLDTFESLAQANEGGVGLCLQANLRRTPDDIERLSDVPGAVRLVKGAYDEPKGIAYTDRDRIDEAYRECLRLAFETYDGQIAVGSHDPEMIELATDLNEEFDASFELQMLMGVRPEAQRKHAREYDVWQYVPYGGRWMSYFYRRIRERKENLLFAARAVGQQVLPDQ